MSLRRLALIIRNIAVVILSESGIINARFSTAHCKAIRFPHDILNYMYNLSDAKFLYLFGGVDAHCGNNTNAFRHAYALNPAAAANYHRIVTLKKLDSITNN